MFADSVFASGRCETLSVIVQKTFDCGLKVGFVDVALVGWLRSTEMGRTCLIDQVDRITLDSLLGLDVL